MRVQNPQPPHLSSLFIHVRENWHKVHTALFSTGPSEDLTPVRQARTPGNKRTLESANLVFSQSVSQLFPKKIEGNAQSPRAARRDRSQPLATGTSVLQTLQSRRAPSPSPGQTILTHLKCTSHNHRHEVYTGPLTQEKPLSKGCRTED